jgi:hypothetical protein
MITISRGVFSKALDLADLEFVLADAVACRSSRRHRIALKKQEK